MYRISANYDDPWHPLLLPAVAGASAKQQGDVRTVASVAEAMAIVEEVECDLGELMPGERCEAYGFGAEYIVERI